MFKHIVQVCCQCPSRSHLFCARINGARLVYSMNLAPCKAPIILYLHGGPGDACIPLTMRYNSALEEDFRFINLDQRGSGLSYYPFAPDEKVSLGTMVEDIHQFVRKLLSFYRQDSLILIGHSWGSVLGLEMVRMYPSLIKQYIGLGQVINMRHALELRQQLSKKVLPRWAQKVVGSESSEADLVMAARELLVRGNFRSIAKPLERVTTYINSSLYSWPALINQLRGVRQSRIRLDRELEAVNYESVTSFGAPVTFIEGRFDLHLPPLLVEQFASRLVSQHRFIWFEQSGHCPQWDEPEHFAKVVKEVCL